MSWTTRLVSAMVLATVLGASAGCGPKAGNTTGTKEPTKVVKVSPKGSSEPTKGKTGATGGTTGTPTNLVKPVPMTGDTFRLVDLETVELSKGGSKTFAVTIDRGSGFRSEVKFSLRPPATREARGITFSPADWMFNTTETNMMITARAAADAIPGTYTWTLIVRPRVGAEVTRSLTVVVSP